MMHREWQIRAGVPFAGRQVVILRLLRWRVRCLAIAGQATGQPDLAIQLCRMQLLHRERRSSPQLPAGRPSGCGGTAGGRGGGAAGGAAVDQEAADGDDDQRQRAQPGHQPPVQADPWLAAGRRARGRRAAGRPLARRAGRGGGEVAGGLLGGGGVAADGGGGGGSSGGSGGGTGQDGGGVGGAGTRGGGGAEGAAGGGDELAAGRVPVGRIFGQRLADDLIDLARQGGLQRAGGGGHFLHMRPYDRGVHVLGERNPAGQAL